MSKAKKQNPPKKPKTSKPVPKDVASGAAFVRDATQKSQGRGKRPTPPDVELGAAFVAELDAENSLPIGLEIGDSGIGGSGQQLAKKEFEQKTRKTNRKQIESAIETLANDPLSFEDALLDMPSHLQNSLRDSCERVFERRQRRDLLGLDLHGLTKRQAIRHVNKWIADHIGDYADASNEQKELVVECFRRIKAELGGGLFAAHRQRF